MIARVPFYPLAENPTSMRFVGGVRTCVCTYVRVHLHISLRHSVIHVCASLSEITRRELRDANDKLHS